MRFAGLVGVLVAIASTTMLGRPASAHTTPAYWHEDHVDVERDRWMTDLPDDLRLRDLSIPGTHDSGAKEGGIAYEAQTLTIKELLRMGIRAFDIRLGPTGIVRCLESGKLYIYHGDLCMSTSFDSVLDDMTGFLHDNPGEAIFMRLGKESRAGDVSDLEKTLTTYVTKPKYDAYVYQDPSQAPDTNPTLGAIRRKIVIFNDSFTFSAGHHIGIPYKGIDNQDNSDIEPYHALARKWNGVNASERGKCLTDEDTQCVDVVDQFRRANRTYECTGPATPWPCCTGDKAGCDKLHQNYLSAANGAAPFFFASGHGTAETGAGRLWTGWTRGSDGTCGSANYCLGETLYPSLGCVEIGDSHRNCGVYFEGLNVLAMHYINNNEDQAPGETFPWGLPVRMLRTGIVWADFPGSGLIEAIIEVNWRRFHGEFDVGVIPQGACTNPHDAVEIRTDDEDSDNANKANGWNGAIHQTSGGTEFHFCRVDGTKLGPWDEAAGRLGDYSVLKLGRSCPPGSREFQFFMENERNNNASYVKGDAWPNRQNTEFVGTWFNFCQFEHEFGAADGVATMPDFPALPEVPSYGVFAHPAAPFAHAYGNIHIDEEDFRRGFGTTRFYNPHQVHSAGIVGGCNSDGCSVGTGQQGDGDQSNTDLNLTKVVAACGDGFVDAGEACDDGNTRDGDCCSADCKTDHSQTVPCPSPTAATIEKPALGERIRLADGARPGDRRTFVALAGPALDLTGIDPTVTGAQVFLGQPGGADPVVFELPAAGWSRVGRATVPDFRFRVRGSTVLSARLRSGRVFALSARGPGAYPLGAPQGTVAVNVDVGQVRFCGEFGGQIQLDDAMHFLARQAPAPASCPVLEK